MYLCLLLGLPAGWQSTSCKQSFPCSWEGHECTACFKDILLAQICWSLAQDRMMPEPSLQREPLQKSWFSPAPSICMKLEGFQVFSVFPVCSMEHRSSSWSLVQVFHTSGQHLGLEIKSVQREKRWMPLVQGSQVGLYHAWAGKCEYVWEFVLWSLCLYGRSDWHWLTGSLVIRHRNMQTASQKPCFWRKPGSRYH